MPPGPSLRRWLPWLLTAGLLYLLVQGVGELPEVASRLRPESFRRQQASLYHGRIPGMEMERDSARASLEALELGRKLGFPTFPGAKPPNDQNWRLAWERSQARLIQKQESLRHLRELKQRWE